MQNKREKIRYFIIQKLMGLALMVTSVIGCKISGDGTAAVLLIPIGIYTIFTQQMVITNSTYFVRKLGGEAHGEYKGSYYPDDTISRKRA